MCFHPQKTPSFLRCLSLLFFPLSTFNANGSTRLAAMGNEALFIPGICAAQKAAVQWGDPNTQLPFQPGLAGYSTWTKCFPAKTLQVPKDLFAPSGQCTEGICPIWDFVSLGLCRPQRNQPWLWLRGDQAGPCEELSVLSAGAFQSAKCVSEILLRNAVKSPFQTGHKPAFKSQ